MSCLFNLRHYGFTAIILKVGYLNAQKQLSTADNDKDLLPNNVRFDAKKSFNIYPDEHLNRV
jgi:hypothetical protein